MFIFCGIGLSQSPVLTESSWDNVTETTQEEIVYPNPTYGKMRLNLNQFLEKEFLIEVKNIIGKKLWSEKVFNKNKVLDLSFLHKGSYLFTIRNIHGENLTTFRLAIIDP